MRNYCYGKTTNEVFSTRAQSTTSRTSAYILAQEDTDSDDEKKEADPEADATLIMNSSVVDDMRIQDHSHKSCGCMRNCGGFTCQRQMPDQKKIYLLQASKKQKAERRQKKKVRCLLEESEKETDIIDTSIDYTGKKDI